MKINFIFNDVYTYNSPGWDPGDIRLSGTERGIVEWAEELASRKHIVAIYHNRRMPMTHTFLRGVDYIDRNAYPLSIRGSKTVKRVTVLVNHRDTKIKGATVYYTNEDTAPSQDLHGYCAVIQISGWAARNFPVNNDNVFIVPHGYDDRLTYPEPKIAKQCLYSSSPDRGLEVLLRAWPKVLRSVPDATLKVTYGAPPMNLPNAEFLGDVSEDGMNALYRQSEFWLHPCTGIEMQCIAALKAQAALAIPVVIPAMALQETVRVGYQTPSPEGYADLLIEALTNHERNAQLRHSLATLDRKYLPTIKDSVDKLEEVLEFAWNTRPRKENRWTSTRGKKT